MKVLSSLVFLAMLVATVTAHAVILDVTGSSGGTGRAFGVRDDVSRTSSNRCAALVAMP
jgi:hypothetical protein